MSSYVMDISMGSRVKTLVSFLLFLVLLPLNAQVRVVDKIDSTEILIGEQVHLRTTVTAAQGKKVVFPYYQRGELLTEGVEVLDNSDIDTMLLEKNLMQLTRTYTLTSFDSALYYLPPTVVSIDGKKYQSKGGIGLKVNSVPVDTVHINEFRGPHAVVNERFSWNLSLFVIGVLLFLLIVIEFYLLSRLSDRKPKVKKIVIPPRELPHKVALREIDSLKKKNLLEAEDEKEYYVRLTDVLRQYISERFGFNAAEMTSSEIIDALYEGDNEQALNELKEILKTADLVKFAKYRSSMNDKDRNLLSAIDFVNATAPVNAETPQPVVRYVVEGERQRLRNHRVQLVCSCLVLVVVLFVVCFLCKEIVETFL